MLLLIRIFINRKISLRLIYIPLCFYLYTFRKFPIIAALKDLHSTMLLLILHHPLTLFGIGVIYIPLCFYLYYSLSRSYRLFFAIYIPLCFYLYQIQYYKDRLKTKFTFHYASTYTSEEFQTDDKINDLHSTMLLLIL